MSSYKESEKITLNTDLVNDLHFLITEVKSVARLVREITVTLNTSKLEALKKRGAYLDSLKSRIESLSYDSIFKLKSKQKTLVKNYRALIQITLNVHRVGEFLIQAGEQVSYVQDPQTFKEIDLDPFYDVIQLQLSKTFISFTEVNRDMAEQICESEVLLDELYINQFNFIKENITRKKMSQDMMTLLFIARYFERIGDRFLIIGENILNVAVGETIDIRNYQNIQDIVDFLSKKKEEVIYEFKPFLFSRSGCKVGKLLIKRENTYENMYQNYFYKSGDTRKIIEEIDGLKLWKKYFPNSVPQIVWKSIGKSNSTLVVNFLRGENFLKYLLEVKKDSDLQLAISAIKSKMEKVWSKKLVKNNKKSQLIKQISSRKGEITKIHKDFFNDFQISKRKKTSFDVLISEAKDLEKKVKIPFKVLCHGDFNLDNILYDAEPRKVSFVDVHRSGFKDYAQELSVFVVSALRIKLDDEQALLRIRLLCLEMFEFGKRFAKKHGDDYFQARFALGLFRSFVTSTRFLLDDDWYYKLRENAIVIFEDVSKSKKDLRKLELNLKAVL